ncbi:MAG TPA: MFS transporter, partial [Phycisphaerae bacterium]
FEGPQATIGISFLFASRIIDGISGGNISAASAYIADSTTPENRAKGMGIIGAAFGLGFVFGPAIGGIIGRLAGLQWVPLTSAAFSLGALSMTYFWLEESNPAVRVRGHGSMADAGEVAKSAVATAGVETASAAKKIDNQLRRYTLTGLWRPLFRPIIGPMIAMSFVNGFAFAGMEQTYSLLVYKRVYEPQFGQLPQADWQAAIDKAGQNAGFATGLLLFMVGMIIAIVQGGLIHRLTKKFGEAKLMIVGPLLIGLGMWILAADLPHLIPGLWRWAGFMAGSFFLASGSSIFNPAVQSLVSRHASRNEQGEILGDLQGMASLARALGPLAAGLMFQFILAGTVYQGAAPYWVSGTLTFIVGIWALTMRHKLIPPTMAQASGGFAVQPAPSNAS